MKLSLRGLETIAIAGVLGCCLALPAGTVQAVPQSGGAAAQDEGQAYLELAREHAEAGRWQEAADAYATALRFVPTNAEAQAGLEHAQTMLNQGSTIQSTQDEIRRRVEQLRVEFEQSIEQARELLDQGNYNQAEQVIVAAEVRLNLGRSLLPPSEFEQKRSRATELKADIEQAREQAMLEEIEQRRIEKEEEARRRQAEAESERQRMINANLRRVRQLQMELKYEEALQVIDQILFMDELNAPALALRDSFKRNVQLRKYVEFNRQKNTGLNNLAIEAQRAAVPPQPNMTGPGLRSTTGVMQYPEDWPQVTYLRTGETGFSRPAGDRAVLQRLSDRTIPVNFQGNSLETVVAFMRELTGVDVHVDWKALSFIGVDKEDEVTLELANANAATVMDRVLEQLGDELDRPDWDVRDGILVISSDEVLRQRTVTVVYDIRDLLFQVPYFDNAPELSIDTATEQSVTVAGAGGTGSTFGGDDGGGAIFGDPGDEPDRASRQELISDIVEIIQENIDPEGWRDLGGETGTLQELNGNLIITNTPRNHQSIVGLLSQLREIRALQINVESRFLEVDSNWFEQIGVDLDMYFNTNGGLFDQLKQADPNAQLSDFFFDDGSLKDPVVYGNFDQVQGFDPAAPAGPPFNTVPTGSLIGVPTTDGDGDGIPDQITYPFAGVPGSPIRHSSGFSPIPFVQNSFGAVGELAELTTFATAAIANPALAVGVSYLSDVQVDLLVQATQADDRTLVLTAPRLTFFNGQRAWVAVTTSTAYISGLQAVTGDASGAFIPQIATLSEGFVLDVEGVISADRRYVTMTVIASLAQNAGFRETDANEFGGAAGGGGAIGGSAGQFNGRVELPQITLSLVQTTVSVPDKGTILLGGQRFVNEIEVESGVPVLSKIPIINRFFTNRLSAKEERSLLILIRPEIIIQQEHEDILFPGLSDDAGIGAYMR